MEAISYDKIAKWLEIRGRITVPTLGRRKTLDFWIENGIINGCDTHGNHNKYSVEYWNEICAVIDNLPTNRREVTTEYCHCRYYYKSQGVPALCRAYCLVHNL